MADQIVITEKTSQAKDVRAAVGSRYGDILPAEGHLLDLLEPEDVVPAWKRWSPILLRPEGLYGTRPADGGNKAAKLKAIREALRTAKLVWLATDCDREGQLIGQEILEHYNYRGQVMRVLFTAQDSQTIRDAFGRAKPNAEYASLYAAAVARRQADQIYNLSLTRTATVILGQDARGVIGVGRVKTPTLAIVCKRELEIRNFVPQAYFEVVATANVAGGQFQMRHAPQERIVRREVAEKVVEAAQGFEGPLGVRVEDKRQGPPKLHDLPSLQKLCSSRFGWAASKTLEVAQELYDGQGKKIITYPRAEVRYLPESLISDVPKIVAGLQAGKSFTAIPVPDPPIIRKGASGSFHDKGLEGASHHAVIPNVNTVDNLPEVWPRLSTDEKKLFDVIARAYLAAVMPDFRYRQTTATLDVGVFLSVIPVFLSGLIYSTIPKLTLRTHLQDMKTLDSLLAEVRTCRACADVLLLGPRPVVQISATARILVASQAPGTKVHDSGIPFSDASGDRLREWMGVSDVIFYDERRIAILPMGLCYPGRLSSGGEAPPRPECAPLWRDRLLAHMPDLRLTLLVGSHAQINALGRGKMTERVMGFRDHLPTILPLPHPSWRSRHWEAQNPWFDAEVIPTLRDAVQRALA